MSRYIQFFLFNYVRKTRKSYLFLLGTDTSPVYEMAASTTPPALFTASFPIINLEHNLGNQIPLKYPFHSELLVRKTYNIICKKFSIFVRRYLPI